MGDNGGVVVNAVFIGLTMICMAWAVVVHLKLLKLRSKFKAAIVLIPLFKKTRWTVLAMVLVLLLLVANLVLMFVYPALLVTTVCLIAICITILSLLIALVSVRCAVLDDGIVVPFRYIQWTQLSNYVVSGNTIFFYGDDKGFDSLTHVTKKLFFDKSNLEKLHYILSKHKKED
jgi:hypothetical protein